MSIKQQIDFVAPPYAGHLFPLIQIATGLVARGYREIRIISTIEAQSAVAAAGLEFVPILVGSSRRVFEISNTKQRVGSNPFRLLAQLRQNLSLLQQLQNELRHLWEHQRPDRVIADFTVPIAGLLARSMDIPWWTTIPTPCALETGDGVPSYLGGWKPWPGPLGALRDQLGRVLTRGFKRTIRWLFRRQLISLGVERIYRRDGSEFIYSPEKILALGVREFEFPRSWPAWMEFVGPTTGSPNVPHGPPTFSPDRRHVLVSLGTHLWWAKDQALRLLSDVARELPQYEFHFSLGKSIAAEQLPQVGCGLAPPANLQVYDYLPYDRYINNFDLALIHGGTGVMYQCLQAGLPVLSWPQDFDQFDHTARLEYHGLGLRCRPKVNRVVTDLLRLDREPAFRQRCQRFARIINQYSAIDRIESLLNPK